MRAAKQLIENEAPDRAPAPVNDLPIDGPDPEFVVTPTSKQITQALAYAHNSPTIVLIYGSPGVSKTTTAARFAREHPARPDSFSSRPAYLINLLGVKTPTAMFYRIADCFGPPAGLSDLRNRNLLRWLTQCLHPGVLLILDECQTLDHDALDAARYFLDELHVGLVLMGNTLTYAKIAGKNARAQFAQLSSRIGLRLHIPHPTEADADAVLSSWGVSTGSGRDYGRQLASGPGGLRQMVQVLRQARIAAAATRQPLDHRLMHSAANALGLAD
jgi:DNA transposition AAA+ family ATPase